MTKLLHIRSHRDQLLAAAGFSDKAKNNLSEGDLENALGEVFKSKFCEAGVDFREEIFYRYLLTKGDSLGGQMRNLTGAMAQGKLSKALIDALGSRDIKPRIIQARDTGKVQEIIWPKRRMFFDVKPRLIDKNIDVILTEDGIGLSKSKLLALPNLYRACGELKGGIDPAGADEHWKTAQSALDRIRDKLAGHCPPLFFVGAAIEAAMATEIFENLSSGKLTHAANLTNDQQVDDVASWLVQL